MRMLNPFLMAITLGISSTAYAATNSQGTVWKFEEYNPSANTVAKFDSVAPYTEIYPIEATTEALEEAISRFYDHGESPSEKLLALIKGPTLYLQVNGTEYVLNRTKQSNIRTDGSSVIDYTACNYPQQDDELVEVYTNTRYKLSMEVHTLNERYFAMAYSPIHHGYRDLKLPAECASTQRYNSFSKGYAKMFKDGTLVDTLTILRQDLKGDTPPSEN